MKKIYLFLVALFVTVGAMAQTPIFKESFGDVGNKDNKPYVDAYTGWDNPECTFTGKNVSIRMTSSLPTHAWFPKGKTDSFLKIAGAQGGKNLTIGFDFAANKGGLTTDELVVKVNGVKVNFPATTADKQNVFVTVAPVAIADAEFLDIEFTVGANGMATEGVRIDNIVVYGTAGVVAVEAPVFSVATGLQQKAFNLELTCPTSGADIYYTLNGGAETKYTSAINIATTTTVKAWAVKGSDKSREVEATYYFTEYVENATIEQFLAAEVSDYKWYKLTGTIKEFGVDKNGSSDNAKIYGNFYLEDATGVVYVYGLTATKVDKNDKSFASLGLEVGDKITIWGTRDEYSSEAQVGGPAYMAELNIEYTDVANIQEFIAKADSTGYTRITGAVNVTVQNGKQVYVQDATGALVIYGATATYETGDALTGIIGKYDNYNGTPEMVSPIFPEEVSAGSVEPKSVLLKNVNAALVSYYVKVVGEVVEDVTFVTDSASNMTLRDAAGNTIVARNKFKFAAEFFEEDLIEVTAVVDLFNGEPQLGVISYDWADEFPVAVENVYINNIYTENGLVVADGEFAIFTITGQDVTAMNGRLENGIYIVKTAKSAVKVVVK